MLLSVWSWIRGKRCHSDAVAGGAAIYSLSEYSFIHELEYLFIGLNTQGLGSLMPRHEARPSGGVALCRTRPLDDTALASQLLKARVRPTLEIVVTEPAAHLCKVTDAQSGLALIRL